MGKKTTAAALAAMLAIAVPVVKSEEGLSLTPYYDAVGKLTICYGETDNVTVGSFVDEAVCDAKLKIKLTLWGWLVDDMVKTDMTPSRWAGLNIFTYNVGLKAFKNSTLLKRLNANDPKACDSLTTKDYDSGKCRGYGCGWAAGKQLPGLIKRRKKERALCLK